MEIKFNNVCKTIGTKKILSNVSFSIPPGSVFALIGPNGAGKTTIGRILLNTYEVSSGSVTVDGVNVSDKKYAKLKDQIGFVLDNLGLFNSLNAWQNVEFFDRVYHKNDTSINRVNRIQKALASVDLLSRKDEKPTFFSRGMKQRLAIARLITCDPKLVFLDEPSKGLDVEGKLAIRQYIRQLKSKGVTTFLCSHDLSELEKIVTHIAFINNGEILFFGSYNEAKKKFSENTYELSVDNPVTSLEQIKNCEFVSFATVSSDNNIIVTLKSSDDSLYEWIKNKDIHVYEYKRINDDLENIYVKIFGLSSSINKEDDV